METERWVEHMLHNAEVIVLCEMINSNVPCTGIQAIVIVYAIQIGERAMVDNWTASGPGEFFSLGVILE